MARLTEVTGKRIALDTVVFIYALEGNHEFGKFSKSCLEAIEQGKCRGFASDLVLAELMVKPLREGKPEIAREYAEELPTFPNLSFLSATRNIIITAAQLRGSTSLKLIDALHLATAIEQKCHLFITNDTRLKCNVRDLNICLLSEIEF